MARILVVEDEALLGWSLGRRLEMAGYDVVVVQTIADAETVLRERAPDAILLDLRLPDGHGFDLVARHRERLRQAAIIVVTAVSDADLDERARALGIRQFLNKPVAHDLLLEVIALELAESPPSTAEVGENPHRE